MTWVAPNVIQQGAGFVYRTTGRRADLLGMGVSVQNCVDNADQATMYKTVKTLWGGNFLTVRMTLDRAFDTRPQGGDPQGSPPTFTTLTPNAAMWAKYIEILDWAEAEGDMVVVVRNGHTGADGTAAFGGSAGWPEWFYVDGYWDGTLVSNADIGPGKVAPLPYDRAGYGGYYPTIYAAQGNLSHNAAQAISSDVDAAYWLDSSVGSFSGDLGSEPQLNNGTHTWDGDFPGAFPYMLEMHDQLLLEAQSRSCVAGFGWFMEPDKGILSSALNFNEGGAAHPKAINQMIWAQTMYYDAQRILEPTRWQAARGEGGHNGYGSADFSIYMTGGIGGEDPDTFDCPPGIHIAGEFHDYFSDQDTFDVGCNVSGPLMNQNNLDDTELRISLTPQNFGVGDSFRLRWHQADGSANVQTGTFSNGGSGGGNATAAAIQTAVNALGLRTEDWATNGNITVNVTVTGPTNGPFIVEFPNTADGISASTGSFTPFALSGCTVDVGFPDDASGMPNRANVYAGDITKAQENIDCIGNSVTKWGIPFIIGEFSIHKDAIDACNFFTNLMQVNIDGNWLAPMAYFALTSGGNFGVLTGVDDATYAIDPTSCGQVIADLYAIGFPDEEVSPPAQTPVVAERFSARPGETVTVTFSTTQTAGGLGVRILDSLGGEVSARTSTGITEPTPGSVIVQVTAPDDEDTYIVMIDSGITPDTCWAAALDVAA